MTMHSDEWSRIHTRNVKSRCSAMRNCQWENYAVARIRMLVDFFRISIAFSIQILPTTFLGERWTSWVCASPWLRLNRSKKSPPPLSPSSSSTAFHSISDILGSAHRVPIINLPNDRRRKIKKIRKKTQTPQSEKNDIVALCCTVCVLWWLRQKREKIFAISHWGHRQFACSLASITGSSNSNGILKKTSFCNILCCASEHQRQPSSASSPLLERRQKTNTICVPNAKKNKIYFSLLALSWARTIGGAQTSSFQHTQRKTKWKSRIYILYRARYRLYTFINFMHTIFVGAMLRCASIQRKRERTQAGSTVYVADTHYIYC